MSSWNKMYKQGNVLHFSIILPLRKLHVTFNISFNNCFVILRMKKGGPNNILNKKNIIFSF